MVKSGRTYIVGVVMAQPLREAATDQLRLPYCTLRSLRVRAAYHCIGLDKKYKDTNTHSPLSESESRLPWKVIRTWAQSERGANIQKCTNTNTALYTK